MKPTSQQLSAALQMVAALADTIRQLGRVPSGHLYAQVMGCLDLHSYEAAIGALVSSGVVRREGHEIVWNVPVKTGRGVPA